jgi:hypothetical protein
VVVIRSAKPLFRRAHNIGPLLCGQSLHFAFS